MSENLPSNGGVKRVFVDGATGFVGTNVIEELVARGIEVSALAHSSSVKVDSGLIRETKGGLFGPESLAEAMAGCDAAIHLVGIIEEKGDATFEKMHVDGTRVVLEAAKAAGVERYVHMSALGSRANAVSEYHKTKYAAEQLVKQSGLTYTIFRPSMIHGPRGEFMRQAAGWARGSQLPFLFMPYFGKGLFGLGGSGKIAPVYVKDVARAFADALTNDKARGRIYNVCGPDAMDWPTMHKIISTAVRGEKKAAVPVPAWYAKAVASVVPASWIPFNKAQVQMSQEDNVGDMTEFLGDFDIEPAPFEATVQSYGQQLR